jgi:hypothetical protein
MVPADEYSYVAAPLKPRRPTLSAATVVEPPAEQAPPEYDSEYDMGVVNAFKAYKRFSRAVIRTARSAKRAVAAKFSQGGGELPPEDLYSYVTAPKRPRLPHLSAAAVAELPEE